MPSRATVTMRASEQMSRSHSGLMQPTLTRYFIWSCLVHTQERRASVLQRNQRHPQRHACSAPGLLKHSTSSWKQGIKTPRERHVCAQAVACHRATAAGNCSPVPLTNLSVQHT